MRAAAAAALAAATLLPGEPLGAGVVLVAVLVALAAARASKLTLDGLLFGSLALVLAALPAVRDAGWVVAFDLAGAWLLGAVAVCGPTPAAALAPFVRLRDLPALKPPLPSGLAPVVRGAFFGSLLVIPFGALFWTADAAFAELSRQLPFPSPGSLPGRGLAFVTVLLVVAGFALAGRRPLRAAPPASPWRLAPWEWGIPLALLDALFLAFVLVQVAVLFGGHEHVLRTAGLSYAEYAREGFWQLLGAAALTLAVLGLTLLVADTPRRPHRLLLRLLLGLLCAFTIVVLVSALRRLLLYEEAFGLTRLRLFAEAFALWLGGLFALLVAAGLIPGVRRRLPRIAVGGTASALAAFSLANPDGLIGERNVGRWREPGRLDVAYLQKLSADSAPALAGLPPSLRRKALAPLSARLARDEPWSSFNLARARARELLAEGGG